MAYIPAWEEEYQDLMNEEINEELKLDKELEKPIVSTGRIGMTITEGRQFGDFRKTLTTAARKGTTKVEFATATEIGYGPEAYGKTKRQELKELSFATGVQINSVHTPTWVEGLSGIDLQQGKISDEKIQRIIKTTEHTMEFAADIQPKDVDTKTKTNGVSIVVHVAEYPYGGRPPELKEVYEEEEKKYGKFVVGKDQPYYLVDTRGNQIIGAITKRFKLSLPKVPYEINGNEIRFKEPWENGTNIEVFTYDIDEVRKVTEKLKLIYHDPKKIEQAFKNEKEKQLALHILKVAKDYKKISQQDEKYLLERPHLAAFLLNHDSQKREIEAWINHYEKDYHELIKQYQAVKEYKDMVIKAIYESKTAEEFKKKHPEAWEILSHYMPGINVANHTVFYDRKTFVEAFEDALKMMEKEIKNRYNGILSYKEKLAELEAMETAIKPIEDVAIEKSTDTLATLGIKAYEITKKKALNQPVYIAAENWVPEAGFGTHPEELLYLIKKAREKMKEKLVKEYHMKPKDAEKLAKQHIKITLDTEHLALWQNYFQPKTGENEKEAFLKWFKEKIKKLIDEDVIGNVHLVDSVGGHEQMPPGEGELPLKEIVQELIKSGYKGPINSEGWSDPNEQLFAAWRNIANATYINPAGKGISWSDVDWDNVYTKYRVGEYGHTLSLIPDESWKFWSNLPID